MGTNHLSCFSDEAMTSLRLAQLNYHTWRALKVEEVEGDGGISGESSTTMSAWPMTSQETVERLTKSPETHEAFFKHLPDHTLDPR